MTIPHFTVGDILILKKKHPCGSDAFRVMRCGSDIRIICTSCGRDLTLPRETLERAIRRVEPSAPPSEHDPNGGNLCSTI